MLPSIPNSRLSTEVELKLFPTKTPKDLGLTEFTKKDYTYQSIKMQNGMADPDVSSIIDAIDDDVKNGEKYFFLRTTSPFVARLRDDKRIEWLSVDVVNKGHVEAIGKEMTFKKDQSFHINTGSHGSAEGQYIGTHYDLGKKGAGRFSIEDIKSFETIPNVSLYVVPPYGDPRAPVQANQIMIAWCYSYRTAQVINQIAKDIQVFGSVPKEYLCSLTGRVMNEPARFRNCSHFFEKAEIENYMYVSKGTTCPAKEWWIFKCNQPIPPEHMEYDKVKQGSIKLFLKEKEELKEKHKEVKELKTENSTQAQTINALNTKLFKKEGEVAVLQGEKKGLLDKTQEKDQEIFGLKGKVTVLTTERDLEKADRIQAIQANERLEQELEEKKHEHHLLKEKLEDVMNDPRRFDSEAVRQAEIRNLETEIALLHKEIKEREDDVTWRNRSCIVESTVGGILSLPTWFLRERSKTDSTLFNFLLGGAVVGVCLTYDSMKRDKRNKQYIKERELSIERKKADIRQKGITRLLLNNHKLFKSLEEVAKTKDHSFRYLGKDNNPIPEELELYYKQSMFNILINNGFIREMGKADVPQRQALYHQYLALQERRNMGYMV